VNTPKEVGKVVVDGETLTIFQGQYADGGAIAIYLTTDTGEPYCKLTVNLTDDDFSGPVEKLNAGEFFVRPGEIEDIFPAILAVGLFEDTGRRAKYGRGVPTQVWRLKS
jgi:hypothetical protein